MELSKGGPALTSKKNLVIFLSLVKTIPMDKTHFVVYSLRPCSFLVWLQISNIALISYLLVFISKFNSCCIKQVFELMQSITIGWIQTKGIQKHMEIAVIT